MSGLFGRFDYDKRETESVINELGRWNEPYGQSGLVDWKNQYYFAGCYIDRIQEKDYDATVTTSLNGKIGFFDVLLFNREELISLPNEMEKSDEDILFSYVDKNGIEALKNINGDFSGSIYIPDQNKLIIFRDHMGIRPLYYTSNDKFLAFSTELRGLCGMSDYDPVISDRWVFNVFNGYPNFGTENTAFDNIKCVPPGGCLIFDLKTKKIEKYIYWQAGKKKIRKKSNEEYMKGLRDIIEDSIRRRLAICDDPVGAELSGGLDSGVIDILISRNHRKGVFVSWSASPDEIPYVENDERYIIRDICEQESVNCVFTHNRIVLNEESRTVKCLKNLNAFDEDCALYAIKYALPPFANTLTVTEGSEVLKKLGAKVVFTGHGGDEGVSHRLTPYEMYHFHEYFHFFKHYYTVMYGQKKRFLRTVKRCLSGIKAYYKEKNREFVSHWASPQIISPVFLHNYKGKQLKGMSFRYDPIDYIRTGGSRSRLDNMAMQGGFTGVKYLIPFLDYRVVDYAVSIPRYLYLNGNTNRYIYREAFKDILPESLYVQNEKRTASRNGEFSVERWFEEFNINRQYVYGKLDRNLWKKYLDFDFLDSWIQSGVPSEEEYQKDDAIYANLFACLMIQNTIEKSKMKTV